MKKTITEINESEVVLKPIEDIDFSNSSNLKSILQNLFEKNYQKIIIDFSEIERIDSSGLGKLLLFQKKLSEKNGSLVIGNVKNDYIKNLFEMINLNKIIDIKEKI